MRRLFPVLAALCALPLFAAYAAIPETGAVNRGAAFLKSIQLPDGSYGTESPGQNMDSIYAVRAAGFNPALDVVQGKSPVDYLLANATRVTSTGAGAKAALGAVALGLDPRNVAGVDFIGVVQSSYDPGTGAYAGDDFTQSIAILGLACTGHEVGALAPDALRETQTDAGGWGFGGWPDADTTAIAIQALLAAGIPPADPAVQAALTYLAETQGVDGGWGYDPTESNASSTAFVVQALLALGEDPESARYTKDGITPIAYLLSQQNADGSFKGFDPVYATNQVLPALAGRTFCNAPSTPITQVRPPVSPPTPAPSVPLPPATGSTTAPAPGGEPVARVAAVLAFAALVTGAAAYGLRKG